MHVESVKDNAKFTRDSTEGEEPRIKTHNEHALSCPAYEDCEELLQAQIQYTHGRN
jgi:hypothetical protein